jgi:sec-independent protein translocase protein TatA
VAENQHAAQLARGRQFEQGRTMGLGEWLMVGITITIIFSASRMSALGNAFGKFIYSFRKAAHGQGFVDVKPKLHKTKTGEGVDVEAQKKR